MLSDLKVGNAYSIITFQNGLYSIKEREIDKENNQVNISIYRQKKIIAFGYKKDSYVVITDLLEDNIITESSRYNEAMREVKVFKGNLEKAVILNTISQLAGFEVEKELKNNFTNLSNLVEKIWSDGIFGDEFYKKISEYLYMYRQSKESISLSKMDNMDILKYINNSENDKLKNIIYNKDGFLFNDNFKEFLKDGYIKIDFYKENNYIVLTKDEDVRLINIINNNGDMYLDFSV